MKRHIICGMPGGMAGTIEDDECGNWVKLADAEAEIETQKRLIVAYLRRVAEAHRRHALNLLSDTMQNRPEAAMEDRIASRFEDAAKAIEEGRHVR